MCHWGAMCSPSDSKATRPTAGTNAPSAAPTDCHRGRVSFPLRALNDGESWLGGGGLADICRSAPPSRGRRAPAERPCRNRYAHQKRATAGSLWGLLQSSRHEAAGCHTGLWLLPRER